MAAKAAMGNAKRKPMTITNIKAIMRKTMASHQNEPTGGRATCKENIIKTPDLAWVFDPYFYFGKNGGERFFWDFHCISLLGYAVISDKNLT